MKASAVALDWVDRYELSCHSNCYALQCILTLREALWWSRDFRLSNPSSANQMRQCHTYEDDKIAIIIFDENEKGAEHKPVKNTSADKKTSQEIDLFDCS